jgi:hypothetical protein
MVDSFESSSQLQVLEDLLGLLEKTVSGKGCFSVGEIMKFPPGFLCERTQGSEAFKQIFKLFSFDKSQITISLLKCV